MSGNSRSNLGATWLRPTTWGVTWLSGATVAVLALFAVVVSPAAVSPPPAAVGTVQPSMVEMLAGHSSGDVVELNRLQSFVAVNSGSLGDGSGIDVALIDTGVAPVAGLGSGKVLHGPDLSGEGNAAAVATLDTYGHGTHIAGIIAGNRVGAEGIAPGARIISVKVAGSDGLTTVPQVVAAIDWVVEHRNTDGLNIRVLNLSLGQQGVDTYVGDELSAAVEKAWAAGIFVVVAAGNSGDANGQLESPAIDPYVMAVSATQSQETGQRKFWRVPEWSTRGDGVRNPDMTAPGVSIASYRVPGSTIDLAAPSARYGDDLFLGSGTSQAAAAVSGAAAALLSVNPQLDNDDLKQTLKHGADDLRREPETTSGKGLLDAATASYRLKSDTQLFLAADGHGLGLVLPTGATWSGGTWSGATWSGATWSGATWSGATWSGATWSGGTWSGATWSGATWSGATWSGTGWVQ